MVKFLTTISEAEVKKQFRRSIVGAKILYLRNKLTKEDIKKVNIAEWVEKSEGMSLAHMRELVISVMTLDNTFDETIERLNGFKIKPRIKSKNKKVGFGLHGSETSIG